MSFFRRVRASARKTGDKRRSALAFFLAVSSLVPLVGCNDEGPPVTVASIRSAQDADQESWDVVLSISENGTRRVLLAAGHMLKYERPDSVFMILQSEASDTVRVHVEIFNMEGDSSATVVADRITYYEEENRFVANGDVQVDARGDVRIESEHLEWTAEDRKLRTPGFATIIEPNRTTSGYELEANEDLSEWTIGRFSGRLIPEDS